MWMIGLSTAANCDGCLLLPVLEVVCFFKSVAEEQKQNAVVAVFVFVDLLEEASWPLCE